MIRGSKGPKSAFKISWAAGGEGVWGVCIPLWNVCHKTKGRKQLKTKWGLELCTTFVPPSATGQIDPVSNIIKLKLNFWKVVLGKNIFYGEKCCRIQVRRTWLWRAVGVFLCHLSLKQENTIDCWKQLQQCNIQYPENKILLFPDLGLIKQTKRSVIELEESVYWNKYWSSMLAS